MPGERPIRGRRPQPVGHQLRTRVWTLGRLLVLAVALSVTFGAFFLTAVRIANRAREVHVPNVAGKSVAEATELLAQVGLGVRIDGRRADARVPADHVLIQDPEPDAVVRRQRVVRLRISDGQRDPVVPAVVGQAERTAEVVLAQTNLEIAGRVEIATDAYPAGTVVAQNPPATGRASKVALLVNRGRTGQTYVMPDLIGTPGARVVELLRRRGFRVTVSAEVPYPGIPGGVIVRQTPQAGYQVADGEPVLVEISR